MLMRQRLALATLGLLATACAVELTPEQHYDKAFDLALGTPYETRSGRLMRRHDFEGSFAHYRAAAVAKEVELAL